ncbi:MAG: aminoacyl-tRNA hydrolase [Gammaproteobacteria bacterium]|nr:aminoacyl-tRNA hydrolase [Gammaproteobacteria bacterium]
MSAPIEVIAGLGNPGGDYQDTRHNAGFWLLDDLARQLGVEFRAERRFHAETARADLDGHPCHLLKPVTFMNRSGQAVAALARYYRVPLERILVVHDEIDLPPGIARLKRGGGHGGHNGLRDIIEVFGGAADFLRLRLGVGRPASSDDVVNYVLHAPSVTDRALIRTAIDDAIAVLPLVVSGEAGRAMNRLHRRRDDNAKPE